LALLGITWRYMALLLALRNVTMGVTLRYVTLCNVTFGIEKKYFFEKFIYVKIII
jgi:hypothetical protein